MLDEPIDGAALEFRLDRSSGVPAYLQLVHQVEHALRLGRVRQGDRLPTVKEAVASLAINPNTVLKAYRELEHRGLAEGRPGVGTFITGTTPTVPIRNLNTLRRSLHRWLDQAGAAGLDDEAVRALVTHELTERTASLSTGRAEGATA